MHQLPTFVSRVLRRHRSLQIALLLLIWLLGQGFVRWARLPLPGAVVGMLALLVLLATRWLKLGCIQSGAEWLLGEMILFFVPAVLAVLDHHELWGWSGFKVLLVILGGTAVVMATTAVVVECAWRLASSHREASAHVS